MVLQPVGKDRSAELHRATGDRRMPLGRCSEGSWGDSKMRTRFVKWHVLPASLLADKISG